MIYIYDYAQNKRKPKAVNFMIKITKAKPQL